MVDHKQYMFDALQLAECGRYTVSPNPMVGCVIVKNNVIIGQGFHARCGEAHAEMLAIAEAGPHADGATLYVTLEPCCHHGRTPPCVDALIKAGIKKVYVACVDPNPLVAGQGIAALKTAGIDVEVGLLEEEARRLNNIFFHYIQHKKPFVIAKWAMSLDGKTITHPHDSPDISGSDSQKATHDLRQQLDAIIVGANTARIDDPLLTVRFSSLPSPKQPLRIIVSSQADLPLDLKLFHDQHLAKTLIATTDAISTATRVALEKKHIEVLILPKTQQGQVDLHHLLHELGKREITSVLVEGGKTLHEQFFQEQLINKIHVYVAPVIIASLPKKAGVINLNITSMEKDICFTADYKVENHV